MGGDVMANQWEIKMFTDKFKNLSEEEIFFLNEISLAPSVAKDFNMADKYKILSNFYLAKQLEASSTSSGKQAKALNILTGLIVIATVIQVGLVIYNFIMRI